MSEAKEAPSQKCGRPARSTGNPCKNPAGFKTNHPGTGACYLHGAGTKQTPGGAPAGNKNALVTGEYETLYESAFTDEERALFQNIKAIPREQAEHNLKLACIREHRILLRIRRVAESSVEGLAISSIQAHEGWNIKGKMDYTVTDRTSTLDTEMRLEEALTRLQAVKIRAIDQLRAALKDGGGNEDRLQNLVAAIDRSASRIAAAKTNGS